MSIPNEAAEVMEHLCNHSAHGYSQPNRQGIGTGGSVGETITLSNGKSVGISYGDRDCSSAVIEAYTVVGVDCGGASYTGDMKSCMVRTGNFRSLPASTWRNPERGDILLNQGTHVAMALGGGLLGEFLRSENHSISGRVGDQDGGESVIRALYDDNWDCVLRYCGDNSKVDDKPSNDGQSDSSFGGKYTVMIDELNVRYQPNLSGAISGVLSKGDEIVLDNWYTDSDGGRWGRYTGSRSGKTLYVAVAFDGETFMSKGKSSNSTSVISDYSSGRYYTFNYGMNIRTQPNTNATIVGSYSVGQGVTATEVVDANGYIWAKYIGASTGRTRYVALAKSDGSEKYVK